MLTSPKQVHVHGIFTEFGGIGCCQEFAGSQHSWFCQGSLPSSHTVCFQLRNNRFLGRSTMLRERRKGEPALLIGTPSFALDSLLDVLKALADYCNRGTFREDGTGNFGGSAVVMNWGNGGTIFATFSCFLGKWVSATALATCSWVIHLRFFP
ncbi:unnamed protein product, partial [Ectocarpus sp. 6 AP-2014]